MPMPSHPSSPTQAEGRLPSLVPHTTSPDQDELSANLFHSFARGVGLLTVSPKDGSFLNGINFTWKSCCCCCCCISNRQAVGHMFSIDCNFQCFISRLFLPVVRSRMVRGPFRQLCMPCAPFGESSLVTNGTLMES